MNPGPQASILPGGKRLHLHHGPIDLIIGANRAARTAVFLRAKAHFETVLTDLVAELPALRHQWTPVVPNGQIARAMWQATAPFADDFITPMAAVAGAVADDMIKVLARVQDVEKIYVNNGGDVAFYLSGGQSIRAAMAGGRILLRSHDPYRGVASSGWRGRSHSLGIADNVSVIAQSAVLADAAATMIANAVDLPGHSAIARRPARDLLPDSDLGARLVTCGVGPLSWAETARALDAGRDYADDLVARGVIGAAYIKLNEQSRVSGETKTLKTLSEPEYA